MLMHSLDISKDKIVEVPMKKHGIPPF